MDNSRLMTSVFAVALTTFSASAMADVDAAKGYVKEAQDLVEKKDLDAAGSKLELAEVELEGVAAAAKAPVDAAIKATRAKIVEATAAANKPKYQRQLSRVMSDAEGAIGNLVTWGGVESTFNDLAKNEEAKAALGADLDAAAKKFATFKKLHVKKASVQIAEQLENEVKYLETVWAESKKTLTDPEASPNGKNSAIEKSERYIDKTRKRLNDLPEDDDKRKAFDARVNVVAGEFTKLALADRIKEVTESLKRQIDTYKDDWDGYDKETAGPTFEEYSKQSGGKMSKFNAPKSIEFWERMDSMLERLGENEDYQSVKTDPGIKAIVDGVISKRDATYAKLLKFVTAVVDAAEKMPIKNDTNAWDRLASDVRIALGEKRPEAVALKDRIEKKLKDHEAATTGKEAAKQELIQKLRSKADEAWPKFKEGLKATNNDSNRIDLPSGKFKGQLVFFTSDNLSGYRFKPGDFYFMTTLAGIPAAARIDPQLMKQIEATEKAIGRSIGDDDNDGKWEVFAIVTDSKTKLMAKREVEASGTVDGSNVTVKGQYAEAVDAYIIEIVAAKCGPFAGAKGKGVLKEDGTISK